MNYVDGFVLAVPTKNREIYKTFAEEAVVIFKEHGALKIVECWGDDVPGGESLFLRKLLWASLPNKRQKLRDR